MATPTKEQMADPEFVKRFTEGLKQAPSIVDRFFFDPWRKWPMHYSLSNTYPYGPYRNRPALDESRRGAEPGQTKRKPLK